jgi:predicted DNA-binding transcriptional regulator AlpA
MPTGTILCPMERPQMTTELLDAKAVAAFFGGNRPLNLATLYRGIRHGRFPPPVRVGGSSRWLRSECEAALSKMLEQRNDSHD